MSDLKIADFPKNSHIYGEYISENLCDDILNFYDNNKEHQREGVIGSDFRIDKDFKESTDMYVNHFCNDLFKIYASQLRNIINRYIKIYFDNCYHNAKWGGDIDFADPINIQHYKPGGGFKKWHYERGRWSDKRLLVFMTYLNTLNNGGTHFEHQNITTKAQKGLTVIWPAEFTHMHKGQVSFEEDKYIITGWINYI